MSCSKFYRRFCIGWSRWAHTVSFLISYCSKNFTDGMVSQIEGKTVAQPNKKDQESRIGFSVYSCEHLRVAKYFITAPSLPKLAGRSAPPSSKAGSYSDKSPAILGFQAVPGHPNGEASELSHITYTHTHIHIVM